MPDAERVQPSGVDQLLAHARKQLGWRASPLDLATVVADGGLVVDIRPIDKRDHDGELPDATIIDRNVLEWRLDPTSPHRIAEVTSADQVVVVVCDEGYASTLAAATLRTLGLLHATDLAGGFQAWRRWAEGAAGLTGSRPS